MTGIPLIVTCILREQNFSRALFAILVSILMSVLDVQREVSGFIVVKWVQVGFHVSLKQGSALHI